MRKRMLILAALILTSTNVRAEWLRVGETEEADSYADARTIERTGSMARIRVLSDYLTRQEWSGYKFRSSQAVVEFDCNQSRSRVIEEHGYTEQMATGTVTYTIQGPRPWRPYSAGTIGEIRRNLACGKR